MDATTTTPPPPPPATRYGYGYEPGGSLSATLRYVLTVVRRHLWLALAIIAASLALALVATLLTTPTYTASASIQINDQVDEVLGEGLDDTQSGPTDWDVDRFLNTQLDILRSRLLAQRVADRLDLYENERFFAAMEAPLASDRAADRAQREAVIGMLRGNFEVDLPRSTRVADIAFTSTDPEMSAEVTNAFAEEFIQANLQRRFDSSSYARQFVSEQLEDARLQLENSERELNDYARQAGLLRVGNVDRDSVVRNSGASVTNNSLLQLNEAANEAKASRIAAEARWNAERGAPLLSSPQVLANPTVQSLMSRRAQLEAELDVAQQRYLADHPTVRGLQADLSATTAELNQAARNVRRSVEADFRAAASAEERLSAQVNNLQGASLAEQDRRVRFDTLAREADTARSIYEGLLQRYRELNASAGLASSNLAIVDRADPPLAPSAPNLLRNLLLGLLIGVTVAAVVLFLRDQLDDKIHVPEDVEDKLGLSLLGIIPEAEGGEVLDEIDDPKTQVAEGYNSLRGSLIYSTSSGLPGVMVVTSAQAGEGKSTTSYAMAKGLARMGRRVLLVDADLRRPAMHRLAGVANERGLTDLLVSNDGLETAAVPLGEAGVDLIPSGPLPPSPSELLASPRMAQVLEAAAETYDVTIIDSPPVLGLADSPSLAAIADGTVFVVEAERGHSGQLKAALRRLRSVDPVLLGAVLTRFDPAAAGNRYSGYYGRDYYRYSAKQPQAAG